MSHGSLEKKRPAILATSVAALLSFGLLLGPPRASADEYWDGTITTGSGIPGGNGGDGTWNLSTKNWVNASGIIPAVYNPNTVAHFAGTGGVVTIGSSLTFTALEFDSNGYFIEPNGSLTFKPAASATITVEAGVTASIDALISGTGAITVDGPGAVDFNNNNTYSGGTTLTGGATLDINTNTALGSGTLTVTGSGDTIGTQAATNFTGISFSNTISIQTTSPINFSNGPQHGTLTMNGLVNLNGQTRTFTGDVTEEQVEWNLGGIGVAGESAGATFTTNLSGVGNYVAYIFGANNVNHYTGLTTVGGTAFLVLQSDTAGGSIKGNVDIEGNGVVDYDLVGGASAQFNNSNITITDNSYGDSASETPFAGFDMFQSTGDTIGTLTGSGTVSVAGAILTLGNANSSTFSGQISNGGFAVFSGGGITKTGTGTLTLSGMNTYTGATTISAGTLQAGATNTFSPNSAVLIAASGILDLNGFDQTVGSISDSVLGGAGRINLGTATLTTGKDNTSTTFSGAILGTTGGLTKIGTGTLTLAPTARAATYTGTTTVNGGTLAIATSLAVPSVLNPSSSLAVGGGIFQLNEAFGAGTQQLSGLTVNQGSSQITVNNSGANSAVLDLSAGGITRNIGGVVDFNSNEFDFAGNGATDAAVLTGQVNDASGIIGAWATVNHGAALATVVNGQIQALALPGFGGPGPSYTGITNNEIITGPNNNVALIDGAGSGGTVTLAGGSTTTINTLTQASFSGQSTTVVSSGNALQVGGTTGVGGVFITPTGGNLTIGTNPGDGTLTAGKGSGSGELILENNSSSTLTINSVIADNTSGSVSLTVAGSGTTALATRNSYTGQTVITGGTLSTGMSGVIPDDSPVVITGGTLNLNGLNQILDSISDGGSTAGTINLGAGQLTLGGFGTNSTFSGLITDGGAGGSIVWNASSSQTLTLSNPNNSYSGGTILDGGVLIANGSRIDGSGTPLGTGTLLIDGLVTLGTTIQPGMSGAGTTLTNPITLQNDLNIFTNVNPVDPLTQNFTLNGSIDLGGNNRTITGLTNGGIVHFGGVISDGGVTFSNGSTGYTEFEYQGTSANTYTGPTVVNSGVQLFLNASSGLSVPGDLDVEGTGVVLMGMSEQLSSTSNLIVNSTGNTIAGAVYQGLEVAGTSQTAANLSGSGTIALGGGVLTLETTTHSVFSGVISDGPLGLGGSLELSGNGTLVLSGLNTYTGTTFVIGGTLQIGDETTAGSIASTNGVIVFNGGTFSLVNVSGNTFARSISNDNWGGVGTLLINSQSTLTLSGTLSDGGTGQLTVTQSGSGTTILTATNAYTGATNINSGNLEVNGSLAAASTVNVHSTLSGFGTVAGTATVFSGGTILPGSAVTPGILTVGNLILNPGSTTSFLLNQAGVSGNGVNSLLAVTNNLTLGGTLSITALSGFGAGDYTLFTYGGTLAGNFSSVTSLGSYFGSIDTSVKGKVMLDVFGTQYWDGAGAANDGTISGGSGNWDNSTANWTNATGTANSAWSNGIAVFGGTAGTVKLTAPITAQELTFNSTGYVLAGTNSLKLTGFAAINVTTMGDAATVSVPITGSAGLNVGGSGTLILTSGTNSYTGVTSVSNGVLQIGAGTSAAKIGTGAIVLDNGGTLSLVDMSGTTFSNSVTNGVGGLGVLQVLLSNSTTLSGPITNGANGQLGLTQGGSGTTILTNTGNNFTGGVTISKGTLQVGTTAAAGSLGASSVIQVGTGGTLSLVNVQGNTLTNSISNGLGTTGLVSINSTTDLTLSGALSDGASGTLAVTKAGTGTATLTGSMSYSGPTTVNAGTLQLGNETNGFTGTGAVSVSGTATLAIDLADASTFAPNVVLSAAGTTLKGVESINVTNTLSGVISGLGAFTQAGAGTTILTGTNTYTGATSVNTGILKVDGSLAAASLVKVATAGTLTGNGTINGNATLTGGGIIDFTSGGTIAGTLGVTGGTWFGVGTVEKFVTSSNGAFDISGTLTAPGGLAVTGGNLVGPGTLAGSLNYTSSTNSTFSGTIADGAAPSTLTMNHAGATLNLTGPNTYSGGTTITAGTLEISDGGQLGTANVVDNGTLAFNTSGNVTVSNIISGKGILTQNGSGLTILPNAELYTGATAINEGTLEVDSSLAKGSTVNVGTNGTLTGTGTINGNVTVTGNGQINLSAGNILGTLQVTGGDWNGQGKVVGLVTSSGAGQTFTIDGNLTAALGLTVTAGSLAGTGTLAGILNYTSSTNSTFGGVIANTVPVSTLTMNKAGATLTLTGGNTYSGVTNITAGTLQIGNGGTTGQLGTGNVVDNGILAFDWSAASTTVVNPISGTGVLNQIGSGTTILNATDTYTGATNVTTGTLEVDGSLAAGSTVNVATGGTLTGTGTIHGKATLTGNGNIDFGTGGNIAGTLAVTGGNWIGVGKVAGLVTSSSGLFTITNGATLTAPAGLAVTGGTFAGPGTLAGSLNYTSSASSNFNGNIVDGLAPSSLIINKAGSTLTLDGTYSYTGPTTITSGTLFLGDTVLGNTAVTVNSGGILAGGAPVAGPVTVNSGGTLSVGTSTFANTMTTGTLTLKTGAKVNYLLGAAGTTFTGVNDLTDVNGNVALAGTLNLTAGFGFGAGNTYELFSYTGTATGTLALGTLPAGFTASNFTITNNAAAKEITLTVTGGPVVQYWNGSTTTANNSINGGSGTWDNVTTNWTNSGGATAALWAQSIAVFSSGSGTVTTGDNLTVAAMGFVPGAGQYTVNVNPNNTLTLTGAGMSNTTFQTQSIVNVADGSGAFGSIVFTNSASASAGSGSSIQYTNQAGAGAGSITFQNSSTAGNATITNSGGAVDSGPGGSVTFNATSTAGSATIVNNGGTVSNAAGGSITFQGTSTAGSATITNNGGAADSAGGATTSFLATSTAGTATIIVNGGDVANNLGAFLTFNNSATAGHATITTNGGTVASAAGGFTSFSATSTAGSASITTNGASASGATEGLTTFNVSATAGAAILITNGGTNGGPGGMTLFQDTADGGTAQAITNGNGVFDISGLTDAGMKIGSIAGSGTYNLGVKTLTVGGNNLSTTVSGIITDGGLGGSLVKTGTGALTLSGPNSYTGTTTVSAGTLQIGDGTAGNLASPSVAVAGTASLVTDLANASTFTPNVNLGAATAALKATQSGTNTLSGVISGTGVFDQAGSGTTILTKTETYTGATNVTAGTLQIGNGTSGNLASSTAVTVSGSATVVIDQAIATFFASKVNLSTSTASFEAIQPGASFINGVISGPGSFDQNGNGTTIITGTAAQAYTGATNVNAGILEVDTGLAAGSTVNVATGGTLTGSGKILGKATLTGNGTIKLAASASITGPLSVNGGNWANVGKVTGLVTASSGIFNITGNLTATAGVAVSGGTLAGDGTVTGAVTLNNGGTIEPGAATLGTPGTTFHATSMIWNGGGTLTMQLGSSANDALALTGALTKGSAGAYTVDILDDSGIPQGNYTLATFAATTFAPANFTLELPGNYLGHLVETSTSLVLDVVSGNGQQPAHSESADGADLVASADSAGTPTLDFNPDSAATSSLSITPTPEPSSALLLTFGGATLLGWRRRKRG